MYILTTEIKRPLLEHDFNYMLRFVPSTLHKEILRYKRWQDRQASLFGKLLLAKGLGFYGIDPRAIGKISFNAYKRPYLADTTIDFNISHTEELVVCFICNHVRVGVDIEKVKKINLEDFQSVFTPKELEWLNKKPEDYRRFYRLWTMKEALVKAEGSGLHFPLLEIDTLENPHWTKVNNYTWYYFTWELHKGHMGTIVMNRPKSFYEVTQVQCDYSSTGELNDGRSTMLEVINK